jgi:hypothetical protein
VPYFGSNDGVQPDRIEIRVRAGCGAAVGLVAGVVGALFLWTEVSWWGVGALGVACAALYAWLAARMGDRFWRDLHHYLPW